MGILESGEKWFIIGARWDKVENMFLGEFTHKLDDKNRLTLPKSFLKDLGKSVVITRGLDKSLFLYPKKEWKKVVEKIKELSFTQSKARGFARFMLAGAYEIQVDKSGRILIPEHLRDFAKLKDNVVIAGVSDRIELWDERAWRKYTGEIEKDADSLAEALGELGIL